MILGIIEIICGGMGLIISIFYMYEYIRTPINSKEILDVNNIGNVYTKDHKYESGYLNRTDLATNIDLRINKQHHEYNNSETNLLDNQDTNILNEDETKIL